MTVCHFDLFLRNAMVDQQCNTFLRQRTIQLSTDAIYDRPNRAFFSATVGQINDRYLAGGQQGVHFFFTGFTTLEHVVCTWIYDPPAMDKILGDFFTFSLQMFRRKKLFFVYFRLSFGVHFNTSSVFLCFVCFPRFFSFHFCRSVSASVWWMYYYYCWYLFRSFFLALGSCSARLFCSHQTPEELSAKGERGSHANRITHVNG